MSPNYPASLAIKLRAELGLTERAIDLDQLATDLGFKVIFASIVGGAEGLSVEIGGEQVILINSDGRSSRRKRFTLAHELGHSLLAHTSACRPLDVLGRSSVPEERAANEFAANLLMPPRLFRGDVAKIAPRMAAFEHLAKEYLVSRAAAALRFLKFTDDSCALISIGPGNNWVAKSSRADSLWIKQTFPDHYSTSDLKITSSHVVAGSWIENYQGDSRSLILEEVAPVGPESWLILLSELPSVEDQIDPTEAEAEAELQRRRNSGRAY